MRFEQFTEKAKEVISLAQDILLEHHHNCLLYTSRRSLGFTERTLEKP